MNKIKIFHFSFPKIFEVISISFFSDTYTTILKFVDEEIFPLQGLTSPALNAALFTMY